METTKLSSQGQVTIPQSLREQPNGEAGQKDGILLKSKKLILETTLDAVAGRYKI